jgi:transposase InsO family protein
VIHSDHGTQFTSWAFTERRWKTRVELANAIFEYIEIFHNRRRRHTRLGMRTPIEFELLRTTTPAA